MWYASSNCLLLECMTLGKWTLSKGHFLYTCMAHSQWWPCLASISSLCSPSFCISPVFLPSILQNCISYTLNNAPVAKLTHCSRTKVSSHFIHGEKAQLFFPLSPLGSKCYVFQGDYGEIQCQIKPEGRVSMQLVLCHCFPKSSWALPHTEHGSVHEVFPFSSHNSH